MKLKFNYISLFIFVLFFQGIALGQNTSIKIMDENSQNGIPFANVTLYKIDGELLKGLTTDGNGVANFDLNQRANYKVSFLGYETLEGQISRGEHITL